MGAMITISGLMLYPIPRIQRYLQDKENVKDLDMGKKPSHDRLKKAVVLLDEEINI
jgi:glycyl-tRNA synthetase alpha subunit